MFNGSRLQLAADDWHDHSVVASAHWDFEAPAESQTRT